MCPFNQTGGPQKKTHRHTDCQPPRLLLLAARHLNPRCYKVVWINTRTTPHRWVPRRTNATGTSPPISQWAIATCPAITDGTSFGGHLLGISRRASHKPGHGRATEMPPLCRPNDESFFQSRHPKVGFPKFPQSCPSARCLWLKRCFPECGEPRFNPTALNWIDKVHASAP